MLYKFDVLKYLAERRLEPESRSAGRFAYLFCPQCDDGSQRHLWIKVETGRWGCWKNRAHGGGPGRLVQFLERVSWHTATERVRQYSRAHIPDDQELPDLISEILHAPLSASYSFEPDQFPTLGLPVGAVPAWNSTDAMSYLFQRGFGTRDAKEWGLHYCADSSYETAVNSEKSIKQRYWRRLMFPVHLDGRLISFQGRDITGCQSQPYLAPPVPDESPPINRTVYNVDRVHPDLVVLVEGVFDALAVGPANGAAIFGKELYPNQVELLYGVRPDLVVVALDEDATNDAERIAFNLKGITEEVRILPLPPGEDPASLGRARLWEMIKKA